MTTISPIFLTVYQEPVGISGLHYLSQGLGVSIMAQFNARTMDTAYAWLKKRYKSEGKPEYRLRKFFKSSLSCVRTHSGQPR